MDRRRSTISNSFKHDEKRTFTKIRRDPKRRNTFLYVNELGETVVRFHQTDIVRIHEDGSVLLNSGGFRTATTKSRMNDYLPPGVSLFQKDGEWYIRHSNKLLTPYEDRMTVYGDNHRSNPKDDGTTRF